MCEVTRPKMEAEGLAARRPPAPCEVGIRGQGARPSAAVLLFRGARVCCSCSTGIAALQASSVSKGQARELSGVLPKRFWTQQAV